jgi:hypothetical protein
MRFLRDNALAVFFGVLFLATIAGQSVAGYYTFNDEALAHGEPTLSYPRYLVSSAFGQAVLENWQSEYLQFFLFIGATIWLVQKGSPESTKRPGPGTDREQLVGQHARKDSPRWAGVGGVRQTLYSYSLLIVMGVLFLGSWAGQSVTGWTELSDELRAHGEEGVSYLAYLGRPEFWEDTTQNWQSEFLAVGTMVIFAVYLRARGSAESKPVGAPHRQTTSTE